jgi:Txe/YoeB family toxin of toxin-antitoxin system
MQSAFLLPLTGYERESGTPQTIVETDRKTALRIFQLIEAIMRDPFQGIGKPEPLKFLGPDVWSRRVTQEHRLVYAERSFEDENAFESRDLASAGAGASTFDFRFQGKIFHPGKNRHWKTQVDGLIRAARAVRLFQSTNSLRYPKNEQCMFCGHGLRKKIHNYIHPSISIIALPINSGI